MADSLYPVFDIPDLDEDELEETQALKAGPLFDYKLGDFVFDGQNRIVPVNGRDTYMLWCLKALNTQLGACKAYPGFGIDEEGATDQPNSEAVESALERSITEAIMDNPATEDVRDFVFDWDGSELSVSFVIEPKDWESFEATINVNT